jgi:DNA polymerase-3 subunit epsilon
MWSEGELLAFDLETTGVDPHHDVPVSFALVRTWRGRTVSIESSLVDPGRAIPPGASAVHGISTARARHEGVTLPWAVMFVAERLFQASRREVPVVGMKIDFDLTMLDACYRRQTGRRISEDGFCGPVVDALVLDRHFDRFRRGKRTLADLCGVYEVALVHAHDAVEDARAAVSVVAAMCRRYRELDAATPGELHRLRVGWHREWAASCAAWRAEQGLCAGRDLDTRWPFAPATGRST